MSAREVGIISDYRDLCFGFFGDCFCGLLTSLWPTLVTFVGVRDAELAERSSCGLDVPIRPDNSELRSLLGNIYLELGQRIKPERNTKQP